MNQIQGLKLYDIAYPLYLSTKLQSDMKTTEDFNKIDELEGFIALAMCDYKVLNRVFKAMLLFDTEEHREKAGLTLERRGVDMREVAVSRPVKLKNPMPVFEDYRRSASFRQDIHKKLKLYNDKIYLDVDDLNKICESIREALKKNQVAIYQIYNFKELPFPSVSIIVGGHTYNFATNQKENKVMVEKYLYMDRIFRVEIEPVNISEDVVENHVKVIFQSPTILNDDIKHGDLLDMFLAVNYFIKNIPSSYTSTTQKVAETTEIGKGHNKRYKQVVHLERTIKFDNLKKISKTHLKHIFTCLCWGVRGHYRHLKSGKVIFIQPFKKGKERNNMNAYSEKEYQL